MSTLLALTRRTWEIPRRHVLVAIFFLGLLLRILLAIPAFGDARRAFVNPDSFEYEQIAINLIQGHGYSQSVSEPYVLDIRRTPVYPAVLAATYTLFGQRPEIAIALNLLFGSLACVLTAVLGDRLYGNRAGMIAGILMATDLTSAAYNLTLMTETVFTVALLFCALAAASFVGRATIRSAVLAGFWCGVAILTRPIALFVPLLLGPTLVVLGRGANVRWRTLGAATFFVIATLFPVGWTVRNYLVAGVAQPTSLIAINSYYQRAAVVQAREQGVPVTTERRALAERATASGGPVANETPADLNAMEARSLQIILADPYGYAVVHAEGIVRMLGPEVDILRQLHGEAPSAHGPPTNLTAFLTAGDTSPDHAVDLTAFVGGWVQVLAIDVLAIGGIVVGLRQPARRDATALLLVVLLYFLVISGPEAYPRFRVPFMPIVTVLAALGASMGWRYLVSSRRGYLKRAPVVEV